MLGQSETIERSDVTLVELVVLLKKEAVALVNTEIQFLFEVEDRVDPIAVVHVHRVYVVRFDYIVVDLCCLTDNLHTLASVLVNDII